MFRDLKIFPKIMITIGLVGLLATVASRYSNTEIYQDNIEKQVRQDAKVFLEAKEGHINEYIRAEQTRVVDFASDGFIRDSVANIIKDIDAVTQTAALNQHLVQNKQSLDSSIFGINIFGLDGKIIGSTSDGELGIKEEIDDHFAAARNLDYGQAYISDVRVMQHIDGEKNDHYHFGRADGAFTVSAPLMDRLSGERLGIIVNYFSINELNRVVQLKKGDHNFDILLLKTDGTVLVAPEGSKLIPMKDQLAMDLSCSEYNNLQNTYENHSGKFVLGTKSCFFDKWLLVLEIDQETAFRGAEVIAANTDLIALLTLILALAMIYFLVKSIISPITNLSDATMKLQEGNLRTRVKVHSQDEIGKLAQKFNDMATQLEASEVQLRKFKLAADNSSDQIAITDPEGKILYINNKVEELTGFTVKEAMGTKAGTLWGGVMDNKFYKKLWTRINKKKVFQGDLVNRRKDGRQFHTFITIYPILDPKKKITFFVAVEKDVTKERQIEKMKTNFASLTSHQLNTPLSQIRWLAQTLLSDKVGTLNRKQKELAKDINTATANLVEIIAVLLKVSSLETEKTVIKKEKVDLSDILDTALHHHEHQIALKKIKIDKKISPKLPELNTDKGLLLEVYKNFISNAIKYNKDGGHIKISCQKKGKWMISTIEDSGHGIPKDEQKKIFKRFFRASNAIKIDAQGNGLGIYFIKLIINFLGGNVSFESEENKGTTFTFTLPCS
jgi:PAS domain S-box-containing protein